MFIALCFLPLVTNTTGGLHMIGEIRLEFTFRPVGNFLVGFYRAKPRGIIQESQRFTHFSSFCSSITAFGELVASLTVSLFAPNSFHSTNYLGLLCVYEIHMIVNPSRSPIRAPGIFFPHHMSEIRV